MTYLATTPSDAGARGIGSRATIVCETSFSQPLGRPISTREGAPQPHPRDAIEARGHLPASVVARDPSSPGCDSDITSTTLTGQQHQYCRLNHRRDTETIPPRRSLQLRGNLVHSPGCGDSRRMERGGSRYPILDRRSASLPNRIKLHRPPVPTPRGDAATFQRSIVVETLPISPAYRWWQCIILTFNSCFNLTYILFFLNISSPIYVDCIFIIFFLRQ